MGKVRRDWFEIFSASECQASARAADLGEITASDIVRQAMARLSTLSIDGPEAVASAVQALNDMHKAGALRVRPPSDSVEYVALAVKEPWIEVEVSVTPEMIAAGKKCECSYVDPDDGGNDRDYFTRLYRAMAAHAPVELISDGERIWHTRALIAEGRVAELEGKDERAEAHESLAYWKAEAKRLADGPPTQHPPEFVAQVLMDREGRSDPMALARLTEVIRCARLDGRKQARDEIASNALGYQDPEPILLAGREDLLNAVAYWAGEYANRNQACERQARALGDAANEIATLRTELMAARDTIARFTAANVPDPPKADPIANAIRPRETDRRRIGG